MSIDRPAALSLYRSLIRHASRHPEPYTSQFFLKRIRKDFRKQLTPPRLAQHQTLLTHLQLAPQGHLASLKWTLEQAYGRTGRARTSRLFGILSEVHDKTQPPLIPHVPHTRLPVYPPHTKLHSILLSKNCHTGKPAEVAHLITPPNFPERGVANSREARVLGALSKRREANFRWRWFRDISGRLKAPFLEGERERLERVVGARDEGAFGIREGVEGKGRPGEYCKVTPRLLRRLLDRLVLREGYDLVEKNGEWVVQPAPKSVRNASAEEQKWIP